MLYFLSPYYRSSLRSGANKRFDELGSSLQARLGSGFGVMVVEGEAPEWLNDAQLIEMPAFRSRFERLKTTQWLNDRLIGMSESTVISDFMPIPYAGLSKHKHVQLVHDLRRFSGFSPDRFAFFGKLFQRWQLRRSPRIMTVSKTSRSSITEKIGLPENRVLLSYNGISASYRRPDPSVRRTIDLLYVAAFEARKNHVGLLQALLKFREPLNVVLVGRDHGTLDHAKRLSSALKAENGTIVKFYEPVSEEGLLTLYNATDVYISPSKLEGFGMPLVEALGMGCKLAVSDIAVFREICRSHAEYFDPGNSEDMYRAIKRARKNTVPGVASIEQFDWQNITDNLLLELGNID